MGERNLEAELQEKSRWLQATARTLFTERYENQGLFQEYRQKIHDMSVEMWHLEQTIYRQQETIKRLGGAR